jgi:uncharacterized membrane protein YdjX (TVP38/TMEM64 family)
MSPDADRGAPVSEQDDSPTTSGRGGSRVRLVVLVVLVVAVGGFLLARPDLVGGVLDEVRSTVDGAGAWGPVLFVLAYAGLTVLLVPGSPLTIAAGVLFGPFLGTLWAVLGASLGATGAFLWGRRLGRDAVENLAGDGFRRLDRWLSGRGLLAVLYIRFVPLVPFNLSNPAAGVTGIALRDFVVGTVLGIVPGTFAFAALGGSFDDLTSPLFLGAVALLVVLAVGAPLLDRRVGAGRRDREGSTAP